MFCIEYNKEIVKKTMDNFKGGKLGKTKKQALAIALKSAQHEC